MNRLAALLVVLIVLVLAAPTHAARPNRGTFKGKTSQGLPITIKVRGGAITSLEFFVKNSCGATRKPIEVAGGRVRIRRSGRFRMALANRSGSLTVSGRFVSRRKARGTLRERSESALFDNTCDTRRVRFSVRR